MTQQDPRPVQEDELHAYVDDRLDPDRRAAVERHLAGDAALRQRVEDWRIQAETLRTVLAFKAQEPVPAALGLPSLAEHRRGLRRRAEFMRVAASVVLALGVGGAFGWLAHGPRRPSEIARLGMEATAAYRVFAMDRRAASDLPTNDPVVLADWLSQNLGRRIAVPNLAASGFFPVGARMLAAMYGPAAVLLYENAANQPMIVYVQPMRRGDETAMQSLAADGGNGYAWINDQVGFSVLSNAAPGRLHAIADDVRAGMRL